MEERERRGEREKKEGESGRKRERGREKTERESGRKIYITTVMNASVTFYYNGDECVSHILLQR